MHERKKVDVRFRRFLVLRPGLFEGLLPDPARLKLRGMFRDDQRQPGTTGPLKWTDTASRPRSPWPNDHQGKRHAIPALARTSGRHRWGTDLHSAARQG